MKYGHATHTPKNRLSTSRFCVTCRLLLSFCTSSLRQQFVSLFTLGLPSLILCLSVCHFETVVFRQLPTLLSLLTIGDRLSASSPTIIVNNFLTVLSDLSFLISEELIWVFNTQDVKNVDNIKIQN